MPGKGYRQTKKHKENIGLANSVSLIGVNKGKISRKTIEAAIKANTGKHRTEETKKKLREKHRGKKFSEKTKRKMRESAFEYAKKIIGIICPRIGRNEKIILDKLEQELNYKIIRQYKVCGYFLDGYIPELKLAIEIDEMPKDKEKDIERQKTIEKELNCKFIRIKDYD